MILHRDRAFCTGALAHRDILIERRRALDRGLVVPRILPDYVGAAVTDDTALLCAEAGWVGVVFYDVVFYKGGGGPAVDGEEACAAGDGELTTEVDGTIYTPRYC
jgi:hypothetical protein